MSDKIEKMKVKVDGKGIVKKLVAKPSDRDRVTLYLSKGLYKDFRQQCKKRKITGSEVLEELLKGFLEDLKE